MSLIDKFIDLNNRTHEYIKNKPTLFYFLIILIISLFEIRLLILTNNIDASAAAAEGVLCGTPHWRATQNRILGPFFVGFISNITNLSFSTSYLIVILSLLIFVNYLSYKIFMDLTKDEKTALKYSFLFIVLFLFIQNKSWFYIWDAIDLIVFLLFAYGVFSKKKLSYFVILFFICLLNKENALYIGLWIFIDSFDFNNKFPARLVDILKRKTLNYSKLFLSVLLILGGMIYTKLIRDSLFIKSMFPNIGLDLEHSFWGNQFPLVTNLYILASIIANFDYVELIIPVIIFLAPLYFIYKMKINEFSIKVTFLLLFILTTIFVFGLIYETRIFSILIPFVLMSELYSDNKITISN